MASAPILLNSFPAGRVEQGFVYNFGRGVGAFFPTIIGILSVQIGLGGAIGFGAFAYALCVLSLFFLPETKGKLLVAVD